MDGLGIHLSSTSGVPFYRQILQQVAQGIRCGQFPPGRPVPSARDLAARLLVSLITVQRAYANLEAAGLLEEDTEEGVRVAEGAEEAGRSLALVEGCEELSRAVSRARLLGLSGEEVDAAEAERLSWEVEMATGVQRLLLPDAPPEIPGYDIAGLTVPCREIGGDLYDFIPLSKDRLAFAIADVTGKGVPASLLVSTLSTAIHLLLEDERPLSQVVDRTNRRFHASSPSNRFAGLFLADLDLGTGKLTSVNAGQDPPIVMRKGGSVETLTGGGMILGVLPQVAYKSEETVLEPGDLLAAVTDGITETRDERGEEFGFERLAAHLAAHGTERAGELVRSLIGAAEAFSGGAPAHDDRTIVIIKREEAGP